MEKAVVQCIRAVAQRLPDEIALRSRDKSGAWQTITYREFVGLAETFGAGLLELGVMRGDHVGVISDNRKEWIIANLGIVGIGAVDVPRGSDTMPGEMTFILQHAECKVALAENAEQLTKILYQKPQIPTLSTVIVMDEDFRRETYRERVIGVEVRTFSEIMECGRQLLARDPQVYQREVDKASPREVVTIIYTSGTTGEPKGVVLTNDNFLHQLRTTVPRAIDVSPQDVFLSVLPVWHSFERTVEYIVFYNGAELAYSKPGKAMLKDIADVKPTVMASAPRIWEIVRSAIYRKVKEDGGIKKVLFSFFVKVGEAHQTCTTLVRGNYPQFTKRSLALDFALGIVPWLLLWPLRALGNLLVFNKIKAMLGGRFRFTVSGGGALPPYVDRFFGAAGIMMLEGYGLTETSPVVSVRMQRRPVPGTIGPPLAEQKIKLIDPETRKEVGPGRKGVIMVKGPNVMMCYHKRPDKTREVMSRDGFLNTGDLGMMTHRGELKIIGRMKETIVLLSGENVEPVPIEDAILESEYIDQVMVVGQDQKFLAALVVPNLEELEKYATQKGLRFGPKEQLVDDPEIHALIGREINSRVCEKRGFRAFERVFRFKLIVKHFEVGKELGGTQKMKRDVISEIYKKELAALFAK